MEKVTVVIPNYNGMKYVENCFTSLSQQKGCSFAVIMVDNGSTDGSLDYVREHFPWVEVVALPKNTGFCHGVNVGIQAAKTPYVLLLNNDTAVQEGFIKHLTESIEKSPKRFSVQAKLVDMKEPTVIDDAGDLYCALGWAFALGKGKNAASYYTKEKRVFAACGGAAIYRRDVFERIGYFDENHFAYLEDIDIGYRARLYGYENWYEPKALVHHAGSGSTGSKHNAFKVKMSSKNSVYLVYKNMPFLQILLNLPFLLTGFLIKTFFFILKGLGHTYIEGCVEGLRFCLTKEAKEHKMKKFLTNFNKIVTIQVDLWFNMLRRFVG